jgi:hypothetical protein
MRRRAPAAAMFAIMVFFCAAPARAQGWRWLEKLSGPGDFYGYEVDVKLLCRYEGRTTGQRAIPISLPCVKRLATGELSDTTKDDIGAIVDEGARILDLSRRVYALGLGVSYLRGGGDLEYFPTAAHVDRTVQVWAFEGFFDHRVTDRTDLGVALGANIFVVPEADNFTRWSIEPRFTLKLFDLRKRNQYAGTASLRVGVLAFFKEFDDVHFGAIPGTYQSGTEVSPSVRLIIDFDRNPFK